MPLIAELKRRNVIRVGIAYAIVGWVIAQIAEFAFENFGAPDWVLKSVVVILLLGLPLALFFAWAFELTPEGIRRDVEVNRSRSIVSETGRKLDRLIIAILVIALAGFAFDKFYVPGEGEALTASRQEAVIAAGKTEKSIAVLACVPPMSISSRSCKEYRASPPFTWTIRISSCICCPITRPACTGTA